METKRARLAAYVMLLLGLYAFVVSAYYVLRYAGQWTDTDTGALTLAAINLEKSGDLQDTENGYALGFGYQTALVTARFFTALPVADLQLYIFPFAVVILCIMSFAAFRALTGDAVASAVAALLLVSQPDFLYVVLRGSHEKFTRFFMLLAFYALAKSFGWAQRPRGFVKYVSLFYLSVFTLVSMNAFFGSSFTLMAAISLAIGFLLTLGSGARLEAGAQLAIRRLLLITLTSSVIWYLITFFLYPSARHMFDSISGMTGKMLSITAGVTPADNPYGVVASNWTSRWTYLDVSLPGFLISGAAFIVWVWQGFQFVRKRAGSIGQYKLLPWLLYAGTGVQFALSLVLDRLGSLGSNFQFRLYPTMLTLGLAVLTPQLLDLWRAVARPLPRAAMALVAMFMVWNSAAGLLKSTNDPGLSNYWSFWTQPENQALGWIDDHLRNRSVWVDIDGIRVNSLSLTTSFGAQSGNGTDIAGVEPQTRHLIVSQLSRLWSARRLTPIPDLSGENIVYDNGITQGYHLRPRNPYQR